MGLSLHYLGHASFVFTFGNGLSLLSDYGQSYAYGLDSPIHEIGSLEPNLVSYSHHHADHDRGREFPGAIILDGRKWKGKGLTIRAIPVSENQPGDNYGYRMDYQGLTIFHAGDCQGDIIDIQSKDMRHRFERSFPDRIDLLLAPIDWKQDIVEFAVQYVEFINPRRFIPMHYWSPEEKERFLSHLTHKGSKYSILETRGADYTLPCSAPEDGIEVISLIPAPMEFVQPG